MITITTTILDTGNGEYQIKFEGQDVGGSTAFEGDIADMFREGLLQTRDKINEKLGLTVHQIRPEVYSRQFKTEEERNQRMD